MTKLSATGELRAGFTQAMRRLPSAVTILTAGSGEGRVGMAATAVMSVAADPPTIAIAVNRATGLWPVLHREDRFCVNLLAARHSELVGVFGGQVKGPARFAYGEWGASAHGLPILADAEAALECRIVARIDVATHTLFVAEVDALALAPGSEPLIWTDGRCAVPEFLV